MSQPMRGITATPATLPAPTPRRRGNDRERAAYHEAGHAIMADAYGRRVVRVSIVEDEDTKGRVERLNPRWMQGIVYNLTPYREIALHKEIMVCLAGAAATGLHANYATWRGTEVDRAIAADLVLRVTGEEQEAAALVNWLWIRTRNKLARPVVWPRVEAVATALLEHGELTGDEFRAVIAEKDRAVLAAHGVHGLGGA